MKKLACVVFLGVAVLAAAGLRSTAQAAVNFQLLKIEGPAAGQWIIKGDSTVDDHEGWILAQAANQEVTNLSGVSPDLGPFMVSKQIDRASVHLAYFTATGTVFPVVTFEYGQIVNGQVLVQYRVSLYDTRIIYVKPEVSGGQETETVAFDGFSRVTWTFYRYNNAGGIVQTLTRTYTVP